MGDDERGVVGAAQLVDAGGDNAQSINIQAGIRFIEDGQLWFQDRHLEDFIAFFFAAGKTLIDGAVEQGGVEFEEFGFVP